MSTNEPAATLQTLPSDQLRALQWRFAERYDLTMLIQSSRQVARGPVARLVANGGRNSHDWTAEKNELLDHFDQSGITAAILEPEFGGFIEGPKNLALALIAYELSWVDAGAATSSLASNLGLAPIHERGTPEQKAHYMPLIAPPPPGEDRVPTRMAFALTEPIPFVGVETGLLGGKARVAEWKDGGEPLLQIDKRGRFITGMDFANVVTAAVDSADPRIKGSCVIILEKGDPGLWDKGVSTLKMVHQLSSTCDPVFNLTVPASRIIGGYTVKDGVIVPNYSHSDVIEAVFRRTRVTVGLMTSAKLLSSIEPVIRYHRSRFRGGEAGQPGSPRFDLGIQTKQDAVQRLVEIWATGEAGASLGFETARLFDVLDPLEKEKDRIFSERAITGRAALKALTKLQQDATELVALRTQPAGARDEARIAELEADPLIGFSILDAIANVLCPACKLWNTGYGATVMREAVALMGGYGITEDCPGFLPNKWIDAQLEATYEGPEAVQRRQISITMTSPLFLALFEGWIKELEALARTRPGTGAGALAAAMELWLSTLRHLQQSSDANGIKLFNANRHGISYPIADALCWLLASRQQILDIVHLAEHGPSDPAVAEELIGTLPFLTDLCHVQAARAAGETARICSEVVHGYNSSDSASAIQDALHAFAKQRATVDASLSGFGLAKDRAANALTTVMIPEALDYPM